MNIKRLNSLALEADLERRRNGTFEDKYPDCPRDFSLVTESTADEDDYERDYSEGTVNDDADSE